MGYKWLGLFLPALAAASVAAGASGPLRTVGSELLVNTFTETREWQPATAANADGFVVIWHSSPNHDGQQDGVFAQRFASDGTRRGAEFQVNTFTSGYQYYADVAMAADGHFVVVWQSFDQDKGSNGVFAQRFASDGAPQGVEFQINTTTIRDEREGSIAMDAAGNFVVAWTSFLGDGSSDAVLAQRFDSTGARVGNEFLVNSFTTSTQKSPQVAMSSGSFVVVWQSFGQDGVGDYGVFGRRFASDGAALGVEFQVNVTTFLTERLPDVAMGADGDFVVVWEYFPSGGDREVFARRFASSGAAQGDEFWVNTHTINDQRTAAVAMDATGAFVVAWTNFVDYSLYEDVFARYYDSAGIAQGLDFRVNTSQVAVFTASRQDHPAVAAAGAGKFVVAWDSTNGDDGDYDIVARRLGPLATLDVDGNGSVTALTDGLLVLRRLFGFSDATLTSGAVGAGCTRCTAGDIATYLDGLGLVLDVDGNSGLAALTDGLLILRFEFGFTGTTLTNGAVAVNCTRCTPEAIVGYEQPLS